MEDNYSIDEILSAVNDLQNINNNKNKKSFQKNHQINLILQIFQKIHLD